MLDRLMLHRKKSAPPEQSIFRRSSPVSASQSTENVVFPAVGHTFSRVAVCPQAKLTISQPDDVYEQEADRVADQVMRMAAPSQPLPIQAVQPTAQRKCAARDAEAQSESEPTAQTPDSSVTAVDRVVSSSGQPLDEQTRAFMEPRFGHDFSKVRVHTDTQASASARAINAHAYTVGDDIAFAAGQYAPDTPAGQRLLAHELTHVVQQASLTGVVSPALNLQIQRQAAEDKESDFDVDAANTSTQPAQPQSSSASEETAAPIVDTNTDDGAGAGAETGAEANGSDTDVTVEPLANISGEGDTYEAVAYANTLRLQGRTNASFSNRFATQDVTTSAGSGCSGCPPRQCAHVTGTLVSTFSVATTVTLPPVPSNLTPCQQTRVQNAINTVLAPHEQQHVNAFHTYDGTVSTPFDLNLCRNSFDSRIRAMHNAIESPRRSSAQGSSDALDPFHFDVDLDCTD